MLILTRKTGQTIIIDGDIRVTIKGTSGGNVKVGIDAPEDVSVMREELVEQESAE